jgi:hypothetical protein
VVISIQVSKLHFYKYYLLESSLIFLQKPLYCLRNSKHTVVGRFKVQNVLCRSYTGVLGYNSTRGTDVCVSSVLSCVSSGLVTGCSPFQGVLPIVCKTHNF